MEERLAIDRPSEVCALEHAACTDDGTDPGNSKGINPTSRELPVAQQDVPVGPAISIVLLGFAAGLGPLAMHAVVPGLPKMAAGFGVTLEEVQLVISAYLAGIGTGQLVNGAFSDRVGRRPVLLTGLFIYVASSVLAVCAADLEELVVVRFMQGMGASAGLVLARAMARDGFTSQETAGRLAFLSVIISGLPVASPMLGLLALLLGSWRWIFVFLATLGTALYIYVFFRLSETYRATGKSAAVAAPSAWSPRRISRSLVGYTVSGVSTTASIYAIIAAWGDVTTQILHYSSTVSGILYGGLMLSHAVGAVVARWLSSRVAHQGAAQVVCALSVAGALTLLIFASLHYVTLPTVLLPSALFLFCAGLINPFVLSLALSVDGRVIGTVAAVYGCGQMLFGAVCAFLVGALPVEPLQSAAWIAFLSAVCGQLALAQTGRPLVRGVRGESPSH